MTILLRLKLMRVLPSFCIRRKIYSETGVWPPTCTYDGENRCVISFLKHVEKHWKPILNEKWKQASKTRNKENTRYILSMFPYPSGSLHLGHVRIYTMADIICRYNQLNGYDVLNPMGWDSFGLPAENAAIERRLNPKVWTELNISRMKEQFDSMSLNFDWREATSEPSFYKWTQWLFLQLFKSNLAYKSLAKVNWDPVDCTVLANEQVDEEGRSWRSGAKVEKRYLRQWFISTRALLEDLYTGVDADCSDNGIHWEGILEQQRKWIGELKTFVFYARFDTGDVLPILCDFPELFLTPNSFIAVSNDHWLKNGDVVKNPFNGELLPVKVISNNDKNLSEAMLLNESSYDSAELREKVLDTCKRHPALGGFRTSHTFSDWVVSRQRYWGTPIPLIYCTDCGVQPVPENGLPVTLPEVDRLEHIKTSNTNVVNRLGAVAPREWLNTQCPKCSKSDCTRETDTLDTLFDSSWYYLRFASPTDDGKPFISCDTKTPVWLYLGGVEHVCGHLLFARFVYHFLRREGFITSESKEPFSSIFLQAVVTGKTYTVNGKYVPNEEVKQLLNENKLDNNDVKVTYEKMSKSKGNGVDPLHLVDKYGLDATRLSVVGFQRSEKTKIWKDEEEEFLPTFSFMKNLILTVDQFIFMRMVRDEKPFAPVVKRFSVNKNLKDEKVNEKISMLRRERNKFVEEVTSFNNSRLNSGKVTNTLHFFLNNVIRNVALSRQVALTLEYERCLADLIIALSPIAPHLAEECWQGFVKYANPQLSDFYNLTKLVCEQKWLQLDKNYEDSCKDNDSQVHKKKKLKKKKSAAAQQ